MSRAICLASLLSIVESRAAFAESENYEQIRVDGGITGSSVSVSERSGTGMVAEIKMMVHDNLAVGGRVEVAVMFGGVVGADDLPLDVAMAACGLAKGELYLGDAPVRPFVSLGVGGYTIGSQTVDSGPNTSGIYQQTGRYFGVAPSSSRLALMIWTQVVAIIPPAVPRRVRGLLSAPARHGFSSARVSLPRDRSNRDMLGRSHRPRELPRCVAQHARSEHQAIARHRDRSARRRGRLPSARDR